MTTRLQREDGMAVIVALMAMMLMTALGLSLVLTTSSETMISGNFRAGGEALYAADAPWPASASTNTRRFAIPPVAASKSER